MDDGHIPDRLEKGVRFGCGCVLGLLVGFFAALRAAEGISTLIEVTILAGVVCGLLAIRFGDRFWYALRHLDWFWP